jgi:hypothetical protein
VTIPRRAFETLNLERIRERLVAMQSPRTAFEANERHAGIGNIRITTNFLVATIILDELRTATADAERMGQERSRVDCAEAIAAIIGAIDQATVGRCDSQSRRGDYGKG